jgi:hypothetical protein
MMLAVLVLAIFSKGGVWLYRERPRPYMEYVRIDHIGKPLPGQPKKGISWFDTRVPEEATALEELKDQLKASHGSWGWGKG